jgi:endonuclease/exonuclease/phosphatase family metal-dependent hydrolase
VTGDFNDFDLTVDPNPMLKSSVLSTIRASCGGLETAVSKQDSRSSTVYGVLIDHILVSKHWHVESCVIHTSSDTKEQAVKERTSDHFPVSAKLELTQ